MWTALSRLIIYALIIIATVALAFIQGHGSEDVIHEIAKGFALAGFMILILQVFLASRLKWIERPAGFDILIRYHKHMAVFGTALLLSHPLLLALSSGKWGLITGLDLPWNIWVGRITLFLLILSVLLSAYQTSLKIKFEKWRLSHDILGPLILVLAFTHSLVTGDDLETYTMRTVWVAVLALAVTVFFYHRILRPLRLKSRPYRVIEVQPEAEDVWTVKLAPPEGGRIYPYLPGQFHFITFYRGRDLPVEEHHWTISSSPSEKNFVSSTIKSLGDFTATIGETRAGDTAAVHGAFGRFSYALHPEERDLVFIAGGIGVTPLISMLRHMRDTGDQRSVLLLYANQSEEQIVFRRELADIAGRDHPRLKVVHVLSHPEESWTGETGHVDREKIKRYGGDNLKGKVFYVCGPPGMVKAVITSLKGLGVPHKQIRLEIFTFLD